MKRQLSPNSEESILQGNFGNYTWREHYGPNNLSEHARGAYVRHLQRDLVAAGYPTRVDGYFGPSTQSALTDFQFDHGLRANGIADLHTKEALIVFCTCL